MNSRTLVRHICHAIEEKKGADLRVLDIRKCSDIADYFVIVTGTSDRHVKTLAEGVIDELRLKKVKAKNVEGLNASAWVLVDFYDVIVHVFHHEQRDFYNLERLWGEAKPVKIAKKKVSA